MSNNTRKEKYTCVHTDEKGRKIALLLENVHICDTPWGRVWSFLVRHPEKEISSETTRRVLYLPYSSVNRGKENL